MEISFERILSRCFYEREYRFFPPLRPILDKNRDPSNRFYYFFLIIFLFSSLRPVSLNWMLHGWSGLSYTPRVQQSALFNRSLSALFTSTTFTATHDQNVRRKKKKITHQRPVHLDDTQKKETKKWRQIFQTINPSSCLVSCVYQTRGKMRLFHATCSFELLEDPPTRETDFTYVLSLIWSSIQDFISTFFPRVSFVNSLKISLIGRAAVN